MRRQVSLIVVLATFASVPTVAAQTDPLPTPAVTGTVTYRERIALPATAIVEVTLADVSRADAPAVVVGRQRIDTPGQVPIPFRVDYDPAAIDPRRRYAVRATIFNGSESMFTSTETTLVITQGHGMRADLLLRRVPPPAAPAKPPAPTPALAPPAPVKTPPAAPPAPPAPPLPVNHLVSLPATFSGTLPCADCSGIRVQLNLFRDDSFFMRRIYVGRSSEPVDDLGSWVLSSDRRVLMLKGHGAPMLFSVVSAHALKQLDANGDAMPGTAATELRRMLTHQPIDVRAAMRGSYVYAADAATFTECSTGQRWPVAMEGASVDLERAYLQAKKAPMAPMLVDVDARVASRPKFEGAGPAPALISNYRPALVVVKVVQTLPATDVCVPRLVSAPLVDTAWQLTRLGDRTMPPADSARRQASLEFQADPMRFSGSSGCNRLIGGYTAENASMTLSAAGTMMACPGAMADETAFLAALKATRTYRIVGPWLDLFDEKGVRLARFEAK